MKIASLGIISSFLLINGSFVLPMNSAYAAGYETTKISAPLVAEREEELPPLSAYYSKEGFSLITSEEDSWQTLKTEDYPDPEVLSETMPAIKTVPNLAELTTVNTMKLSESEYLEAVSKDRSYDVLKSIEIAYADVGNTYQTGWSQRGECIISVKYWLESAGANWGTEGTPISNYNTATRVPIENIQAGDVIQYVHETSPNSWITGVHTVLITGNNWDGTYKIVEANAEAPGLVSKDDSWIPKPPAGFETHVYRF